MEDGAAVLSTVDEVRELGAGVVVPTETLQETDDAGKGGEEAEQLGVGRVAVAWMVEHVVFDVGVDVEEELNAAQAVGVAAHDVAQEEVAELHRSPWGEEAALYSKVRYLRSAMGGSKRCAH